MWGTYLLDIYKQAEASEMRDALESLLGPESGSAWSTGGVYLFWRPDTREPLYVGIAGDLPVRFAQHHGLRGCPAAGCKREQISAYFAGEREELGYTILAMSHLSQVSTSRQRKVLDLKSRDLIELNEEFSEEAIDEIRALEGRLLAYNRVRFGHLPRWNTSPGRISRDVADADDGTMASAVGAFDNLLQARKTIRQLAASDLWNMFEQHLHGIRLMTVAGSILEGTGFRNDVLREDLARSWAFPELNEEILNSGYLDQRCPVTVGPVADPPPDEN
jgi:hypothetical protein